MTSGTPVILVCCWIRNTRLTHDVPASLLSPLFYLLLLFPLLSLFPCLSCLPCFTFLFSSLFYLSFISLSLFLCTHARTRTLALERAQTCTCTHAFMHMPACAQGVHGFDEWHSTEASASSSTCNCACEENWLQGGCISGGGEWGPKPPGKSSDKSRDRHAPVAFLLHACTDC
jgi:hypothetical protein